MAIINSVLIGSGTGKVGNVVLSKLKGQQIMKSVPAYVKKPPTPEQLNRQLMLANSVQVYKIFKSFLRFSYKAKNYKKTTYNTFVSRIIDLFNTLPLLTYPQMYDQLEGFVFYLNPVFDISMNLEDNSKIVVEFPKLSGYIYSKYRVVCYYNKNYDAQVTTYIRKLTFDELWSGRVEIQVENTSEIKTYGAYIYSQDKKYLSTIRFQ